ncbi:MAG: SPFH domain-containing protein [Beduini sp.]|uniref:SPFH domain-containing protein n=2 Tax=Beduini sp. TaxID=1922300 RepID=UPI0011C9AD91
MAIIDFVKYNGDPDVFAWKCPDEELSTWTQLIVNESQEAILFKEGRALDRFGPGRHVLDTKNIPLLTGLIGLPFGGNSPFTAEVYFINKTVVLDIKWGTPSPIQLQDPKYNVMIPVRAYGQFGITISDSKTFLTKLVGTVPYFDKESVVKYFKGIYLTKVKDAISSYLIKEQVPILEIGAYLEEISDCLLDKIRPEMAEYGIKIVNFNVNDVSVPEDDPSVIKLRDALAKRAEMDIIGYSYQQERSFDTLEGAAKNDYSGGGLMGAGIGLGLGAGLGVPMGQQMSGITSQIDVTTKQKECPKCHQMIREDAKFCPECGADVQIAKQVECPNCKGAVPEGANFCPSCGEPMNKKCPNCGIKVKPNTKFCPECGTKL